MTNMQRSTLPILAAIISLGFIGLSQAAPGGGGSTQIDEVLINYEDGRLTIFGTGFNDEKSNNIPSVTLGGKEPSFIDFVDPRIIEVEIDLASEFPNPGDYLLIVDPNFKNAKVATMMLSLGSVLFNQSCPSDEYMTGIGPRGKILCTAIGGCDPVPEVCDGLDNDCDGSVDEGNPGGGDSCSTGQLGVCANGATDCTAGAIQCTAIVSPSTEVCDGLDNDCDGSVDDGNPGGGDSCSTGQLGVCANGATDCTAGAIQCTAIVSPSTEVCDGLDNDCDGVVDEGC